MAKSEFERLNLGPQKVPSLQDRRKQNLKVAARSCSIAKQTIRPLREEASKNGVVDFKKVIRDRMFFAPHSISFVRPLATSLFGTRVGENLDKLQKMINGKEILVMGGGKSLSDITSSSDFSPKRLVNVDPFLNLEDLDKRTLGKDYYKSLPFNPTKKNFQADLKTDGYDTFDEIWATFSVPYYSRTRVEVETLFENGYRLLSPDGTFRVFPLGFIVEKMDREKIKERLAGLQAGLASALDVLAVKNDVKLSTMRDYAYSDVGNFSALIIHKTAKTPGFE